MIIHCIKICLIVLGTTLQVQASLTHQILEDNTYIDLKLSPNGKHFAMTFKVDKKINLSIIDLSTKPLKVVSGVALDGDLSVGQFYWANNQRIVYSILISRAWYNEYRTTGEMFGINIDGSNHDVLFGARAANNNRTGASATASRIKQVESDYAVFEMVDLLADDDEHILIKSTPFDSKNSVPTIYKIDINSGLKTKITKLPLPRSDVIVDISGKPKYAYGIDKNGKTKLYKLIENKWDTILEFYGDEGGALPLSVFDDYMYIVDNSKGDLDALYKVNFKTEDKKLLYQHEYVDFTETKLNPNTKQPYMVITDPNKESYKYFEEPDNLAKTHKQLTRTFKGNNLNFMSFSKDLNKLIFKVSSDVIVGDYYLFDRKDNNASLLVSQKSKIKISQLATMKSISYKNRNGDTIHGYFTQAKGIGNVKTAPMIVIPHGGPQRRDYWGFDSIAQVFATNGLSVLQINFTGSDGYGKKFTFDGYKKWGSLIQDDITDGTKWAIKTGLVNSDNICIYGFSFGGYSALMGAVKEPNLYQCVAAGGGVYDLKMMYNAKDINQLLWGEEYLISAIGKNSEILNKFSPANHTDKIITPVFVAHGKNDTRVPIKQAKSLIKNLKKSGVKYEKVFYAKEGHGFIDIKNKIDYYQKLINFFKKHLH